MYINSGTLKLSRSFPLKPPQNGFLLLETAQKGGQHTLKRPFHKFSLEIAQNALKPPSPTIFRSKPPNNFCLKPLKPSVGDSRSQALLCAPKSCSAYSSAGFEVAGLILAAVLEPQGSYSDMDLGEADWPKSISGPPAIAPSLTDSFFLDGRVRDPTKIDCTKKGSLILTSVSSFAVGSPFGMVSHRSETL